MVGQHSQEVAVLALHRGDQRVVRGCLEHHRAEAGRTCQLSVGADAGDQVVEKAEKTPAHQTEKKVFLGGPVQVDGALSDMSAVEFIRRVRAIAAPVRPQIAICLTAVDLGAIIRAKRAGSLCCGTRGGSDGGGIGCCGAARSTGATKQ